MRIKNKNVIDDKGVDKQLADTTTCRLFLCATAATAVARLNHRNSVRLSVRLSVCHTGGSVKNGAS